MKNLLWAAALSAGVWATAQETVEPVPGRRDSDRPPVEFNKDPQQSRLEPTTRIVTNNAAGAGARSQAGANTVDHDLRQRTLVALSTGSIGTQGILPSDQLTDIQVTVTNRVVTLRGEVTSQKNRETIGKRIAGLDGVKRVKNELKVNPAAKGARSDLLNPDGYAEGKSAAQDRKERLSPK